MKQLVTPGQEKLTAAGKTILSLTTPLSIMVAVVSCVGLFTPDFYTKETLNWQVQSVGQDMIDLFIIVPALIVTAIRSYRGSAVARLLWAGVTGYILYTFIIYSFAVHFNRLFILYCSTLGLSFYSLAWLVYSQIKRPFINGINKNAVVKITGSFFLLISLAFYFLWLTEIVPAVMSNSAPKGLIETGLITNPVQVIDLSVFLPGIFITGILMLKKRPAGSMLAIMLLAFLTLMDITIGWLALVMKEKGLASGYAVTMIMAVLSVISLVLLIMNIKNIKINMR